MFVVRVLVEKRYLVPVDEASDAERFVIKDTGSDLVYISGLTNVDHIDYDDLVALATDVIPEEEL